MKRRLATPKGFRPVMVNGRLHFQAVDPIIVVDHENLVGQLLARNGATKCSMPDQIECVRPHLIHNFLLKMDLRGAFASISTFGLSVVLHLDDQFDLDWRWYCHPEGGLIEGAPASPILFHLFMEEWVEPELDELCAQLGLTWTRYVDDFLFSSHQFITATTRQKLRAFLRSKGFSVNGKKTRAVDLEKETLEHLGIVISRGGRVAITEATKRKLRASVPGSPQEAQLKRWRTRVLALNKRK